MHRYGNGETFICRQRDRHFREPATLDKLAAKSGITRRTLWIITDAMVSLGLLGRGYDGGPDG
jgi:hypothetical protein